MVKLMMRARTKRGCRESVKAPAYPISFLQQGLGCCITTVCAMGPDKLSFSWLTE
jgi:hypothetical protein